jgi:transcriptional regulator with XRE-family HTH domain
VAVAILSGVDDRRVGSIARAARHRLRQRQAEVGARAGVSQQAVSAFERNGLDSVELATARRICAAVGVTLDVVPRWRGADLARLLDARHAQLVDHVVRRLDRCGWETAVEWSFNEYGERGSVDVVAYRRASGHLVVAEVKTRLVDLQDLFSTLDRKVRVAARLLPAERGWTVRGLSRLVVCTGDTTARDIVRKHAAMFDAALPMRGHDVARWLAEPSAPIAGLLFVRDTSHASGTHPGARRIRASRR